MRTDSQQKRRRLLSATIQRRKAAAVNSLFSDNLMVQMTASVAEEKPPWERMFCSVELQEFVLSGYTGSDPIIQGVMGVYTMTETGDVADEVIASESWQCKQRKDVVLTRFEQNGSWVVHKRQRDLSSGENNWLIQSCDKAFENRDRELSPLHVKRWAVNTKAGDATSPAQWDEREEISLRVRWQKHQNAAYLLYLFAGSLARTSANSAF